MDAVDTFEAAQKAGLAISLRSLRHDSSPMHAFRRAYACALVETLTATDPGTLAAIPPNSTHHRAVPRTQQRQAGFPHDARDEGLTPLTPMLPNG